MPIIQKYKAVREERDKKREWCALRLLELRQEYNKNIKNSITEHQNDKEDYRSMSETEKDVIREINNHQIQNKTQQLKTPSQLKFEYEKLHRKSNTLSHDTQNLSIQVASLQLSNDNREAKLIQSRSHIENTHSSIQNIYQDCALDGLNNTLSFQKERIRQLRLQLVVRLFKMFDLQIGEESEKLILQLEKEEQGTQSKCQNDDDNAKSDLKLKENKFNLNAKLPSKSTSTTTTTQQKDQRKNPKGYGKIAGLRLPHAGLVYYALFRPVMITSALRHVASLTCSIAQCLKIDLPHPILLRPCTNIQHDIIDQSKQVICDDIYRNQNHNVTNSPHPEHGSINDPSIPSHNSHDNTRKNAASTLMKKIIPEGLSNISRVWIRPRQPSNTYDNSRGKSSSFRQLSQVMRNNIVTKEPALNIDNTKTTSTTTIDDEVLISVIDDRQSHHQSFPDEYVAHASYAILLESCNAKKKSVTEYALIYQSSHPKTAVSKQGSNIDQDQNHQQQPLQQKQSHSLSQNSQQYHSTFTSKRNHSHHDAENHFNIGIQLLQNNVITLCIHAGVSVEKLWPAEAMLLNLHSLLVYCQQQMK